MTGKGKWRETERKEEMMSGATAYPVPFGVENCVGHT
jgi:hypothetical protein